MDVFVTFLCVLLVLDGYMLARNFYVNKFRIKIIALCREHNLRRLEESLDYDCAYDWFFDKYSYSKMLFSFKPLKLKYWYTEEEIERLMS